MTANKKLYKIFLSIVKFTPNVLALLKIITLFLHHFKISTFAITCLSGTSVIFLVILYLISYIFGFCGTYRLSLHYVATVTIVTIFDYYIGIPLTSSIKFRGYMFITGAFITSCIIVWYKNRYNPKIDYIKQLCDQFADCGC